MVTVTCSKTGIQFEAKSSRTKNHPEISGLLTEANKSGTYAVALAALEEARGMGFTTIKEYVDFTKAAMRGKKEAYYKRMDAARAEAKQKQAAESARKERNNYLNNNGYFWKKDDFDNWNLIAPGGRTVTVAQAMDEIENPTSKQHTNAAAFVFTFQVNTVESIAVVTTDNAHTAEMLISKIAGADYSGVFENNWRLTLEDAKEWVELLKAEGASVVSLQEPTEEFPERPIVNIRPGMAVCLEDGSELRWDSRMHARGQVWKSEHDYSLWIVESHQPQDINTGDGLLSGFGHTVRQPTPEEVERIKADDAAWRAKTKEERLESLLGLFPED